MFFKQIFRNYFSKYPDSLKKLDFCHDAIFSMPISLAINDSAIIKLFQF